MRDSRLQYLFKRWGKHWIVGHINAYLTDANDVFVESRSKPLCAVPEIGIGNKLVDNGNYLFEKEEMEEFIYQKSQKSGTDFYKASAYNSRQTMLNSS